MFAILFINRTLNSHFRTLNLLCFIYEGLLVPFLNERFRCSFKNFINWCFCMVIQNIFFTAKIASLLMNGSLCVSANFMINCFNIDKWRILFALDQPSNELTLFHGLNSFSILFIDDKLMLNCEDSSPFS